VAAGSVRRAVSSVSGRGGGLHGTGAYVRSARDVDLGPRLLETPALALASAAFMSKNARSSPATPSTPGTSRCPGPSWAGLRGDRAAAGGLAGCRHVVETVGSWPRSLVGAERFRAHRAGVPALAGLPRDVAEILGARGDGALAVAAPEASSPSRAHGRSTARACTRRSGSASWSWPTCELRPDPSASRSTGLRWRARDMTGAMVRGLGEVAARTGSSPVAARQRASSRPPASRPRRSRSCACVPSGWCGGGVGRAGRWRSRDRRERRRRGRGTPERVWEVVSDPASSRTGTGT